MLKESADIPIEKLAHAPVGSADDIPVALIEDRAGAHWEQAASALMRLAVMQHMRCLVEAGIQRDRSLEIDVDCLGVDMPQIGQERYHWLADRAHNVVLRVVDQTVAQVLDLRDRWPLEDDDAH